MNALDILLPDGKTPPPHEDVPYYIVSQKGWMSNVPTLFGIAQTKMSEPPSKIPDVPASFKLNERKFPEHLMRQAHDFFRAVWNKYQTESSLYIIYNRESDTFRLWAPEQYVTSTSVNHKLDILPSSWNAVGTIHSHCNFSAFHSGTDSHDMAGMPGLHITIGQVDQDTPEYAIAMSMGDTQFTVKYEDIISDDSDLPDIDTLTRYKTHWMQYVKCGSAPWQGIITHYKHKPVKPSNFHSNFSPCKHQSKPDTSRNLQRQWDQQAWGDDESYLPTTYSSERDKEEAFIQALNELRDARWDLSMLADPLGEIGFVIDWSIAYNPTEAADRMMQNATTP
jgi:PRTRC genetic system protein A